MSVTVQGAVPRKWNPQTSDHLTRRLQRLEKAIAGGAEVFVSPALPTFGSGSPPPGGGGPPGGGPGGGVTDHGALTGLEDAEDHSWAIQHGEQVKPEAHVHGPDEVLGLESKFARRGELVAHQHTLHDVPDFDPWQLQLSRRVHVGMYGG